MNSKSENFKICCIIITYGDRSDILSKVVNQVLLQNVCKIILIDNNSSKESKNKIQALSVSNSSRISISYFDRNIGTAKAMSVALKSAYEDKNCDYISILDDDNLIDSDYHENLETFWRANKLDATKGKVILSGFRINKSTYVEALRNNYDWIGINSENNYWGFHLKEIRKMANRRLNLTDSFNILINLQS